MDSVAIEWRGGTVAGRLGGQGPTGVLLAHGAGTGQDHHLIAALRDGLIGEGFTVLTFNYPFMEAGRKRPDPRPVLLDSHRAAAATLRERVGDRLLMAGWSMGGRMGTYLAAEGEPCLGLVLFAYPLHPVGRPDQLRADHLNSISVPMLFFVGTRDEYCRLDLYERLVAPLPNVTTELIDGADHGWRGTGRSHQELARGAAARTAGWLAVGFAGKGGPQP